MFTSTALPTFTEPPGSGSTSDPLDKKSYKHLFAFVVFLMWQHERSEVSIDSPPCYFLWTAWPRWRSVAACVSLRAKTTNALFVFTETVQLSVTVQYSRKPRTSCYWVERQLTSCRHITAVLIVSCVSTELISGLVNNSLSMQAANQTTRRTKYSQDHSGREKSADPGLFQADHRKFLKMKNTK